MKTSISKKVIFISLLTCLFWLPSAFADDSTTAAYFVDDSGNPVESATPSYIYGKPFILEEGFSDPWRQATTASLASGIDKYGYMKTIKCFAETSTTHAYCVVRAMTYRAHATNYDTDNSNPEICPKYFEARFLVTPQSSTGNSVNFACPAPPGNYNGTQITSDQQGKPIWDEDNEFTAEANHFFLYTIVSAAQPTGADALGPSTGFLWKVVCYPTRATSLTLTDPYNNCNVKITSEKPPQILETGVLSESNTGTSQTITTTKKCPNSYTPYVQLTMGMPNQYTTSTTDFTVLNSAAYCVRRITTGSSSYSIFVLYSSKSTRIEKNPTSLTVNDPTTPTSKFTNIQWTLYCYAPGTTVPFDFTASSNGVDGKCDSSQPPYSP